MIFTILYNNYKVINRSLTQLRKTNTLNLPIVALDNHYPTLTKAQKTRLKKKFDLKIIDPKENLGLGGGYNRLFSYYTNIRYAILYDCDSNPTTVGWDKALMDTIKYPDIAYLSLMFDNAKREMIERGFNPIQYGEHVIWNPKQACQQSVSCADLSYLRSIGGLQEPKKYYGGLESNMFKYWNDAHKIGYIDGVYETQLHGKDDTDPKYRSYKWAYAHEGYNGSFDDYLMREAANAIKLDI
jgi:hypothetical protein